mmetsp:Transcript_84316/g.140592  ORF Transcript_84316/g.140592 Transcript_84316/m.140592 type:complete len:888 (+) Transcript_84316:77-2740(+)
MWPLPLVRQDFCIFRIDDQICVVLRQVSVPLPGHDRVARSCARGHAALLPFSRLGGRLRRPIQWVTSSRSAVDLRAVLPSVHVAALVTARLRIAVRVRVLLAFLVAVLPTILPIAVVVALFALGLSFRIVLLCIVVAVACAVVVIALTASVVPFATAERWVAAVGVVFQVLLIAGRPFLVRGLSGRQHLLNGGVRELVLRAELVIDLLKAVLEAAALAAVPRLLGISLQFILRDGRVCTVLVERPIAAARIAHDDVVGLCSLPLEAHTALCIRLPLGLAAAVVGMQPGQFTEQEANVGLGLCNAVAGLGHLVDGLQAGPVGAPPALRLVRVQEVLLAAAGAEVPPQFVEVPVPYRLGAVAGRRKRAATCGGLCGCGRALLRHVLGLGCIVSLSLSVRSTIPRKFQSLVLRLHIGVSVRIPLHHRIAVQVIAVGLRLDVREDVPPFLCRELVLCAQVGVDLVEALLHALALPAHPTLTLGLLVGHEGILALLVVRSVAALDTAQQDDVALGPAGLLALGACHFGLGRTVDPYVLPRGPCAVHEGHLLHRVPDLRLREHDLLPGPDPLRRSSVRVCLGLCVLGLQDFRVGADAVHVQRPVYSVAAPPPAGARARALVRPLRLCLLLLQCARPASARPSPASLRFTTAVLGVGRGLRLRLGLVRRGGPGLCGGRGGHADLASMWRRRRRRPGGFGRVGVKKGVLGGLHLLEHLIPVVRGVFVIFVQLPVDLLIALDDAGALAAVPHRLVIRNLLASDGRVLAVLMVRTEAALAVAHHDVVVAVAVHAAAMRARDLVHWNAVVGVGLDFAVLQSALAQLHELTQSAADGELGLGHRQPGVPAVLDLLPPTAPVRVRHDGRQVLLHDRNVLGPRVRGGCAGRQSRLLRWRLQ